MTARRGPLRRLLDCARAPGARPPRVEEPPDIGVREPRRPRPSAGSGTAVVEPAANGRAGLAELAAGRREAERTTALCSGLDALVVRAPDNVLYLTNLGMATTPSSSRARATPSSSAWRRVPTMSTAQLGPRTCASSRLRPGRSPPPGLRALDLAREAAREYDAVGLELSLGTQASDAWSASRRRSRRPGSTPSRTLPTRRCFSPRSAPSTEQELGTDEGERDRRRGHGARPGCPPGRDERGPGGGGWEGFVHGEGTGWKGEVVALGFSLVRAGIKTFTATTSRPVVEGEPTLLRSQVRAGAGATTKNLVLGELTNEYRELERGLLAVYEDAVAFCRQGASLAELDRRIRRGRGLAFPGSRRTRSRMESAHAGTSRRTPTGRRRRAQGVDGACNRARMLYRWRRCGCAWRTTFRS